MGKNFLFIYFQGKIGFVTACGRFSCFKFLVSFSTTILLSNMKSLSFNQWKFENSDLIFKGQVTIPSNFESIVSSMKHKYSVSF